MLYHGHMDFHRYVYILKCADDGTYTGCTGTLWVTVLSAMEREWSLPRKIACR